MENPEGIIITVSQGMIGTNGYRHWLRNFLNCMNAVNTEDEICYYNFKCANLPKQEFLYIYLLIGGKIRFRVNFMQSARGEKTFDDGRTMFSKGWVCGCGPVVKAPMPIKRKGFQGFRYTEKLF